MSGLDLLCDDDQDAYSAASKLLEPGRDAEIWKGKRRVGKMSAASVTTSSALA